MLECQSKGERVVESKRSTCGETTTMCVRSITYKSYAGNWNPRWKSIACVVGIQTGVWRQLGQCLDNGMPILSNRSVIRAIDIAAACRVIPCISLSRIGRCQLGPMLRTFPVLRHSAHHRRRRQQCINPCLRRVSPLLQHDEEVALPSLDEKKVSLVPH